MPKTAKKRVAKSAAPKREPKKTAVKTPVEPVNIISEEEKKQPVATEAENTAPSEESTGAEVVWPAHPSGRERYFEAVGRRKTAIARVRLFTRSGAFTVNDKAYGDYFPTLDLQKIAEDALKKMKLWERFRISAKVSGGGIHAQAEAVRHGLARCLIIFNPDFRKRMKRAGFLKRDPRMKERKKFGLKKARRAPQWAKR